MNPHLTRRRLLALASLATPLAMQRAHAHHGWSSFDQDRPIYLEGQVVESRWRNPHAELVIEPPAALALPAGLQQRPLPAQSAGIDGAALLAKTVLPTRRERRWELELAPLTRMRAWQAEEIRAGDRVAAVGFTFKGEQGDAVMRVEYLFVGDKTYGLRSSPT
ncbi:DUF6152 family protein [Pseudorhodoferax soli]|uniref:Secreted protein n=1 Tax=Pseudorhodoferax soli TaxID=545864 RepID=A0A368Y897_9BURK|nr:DUF6152 family protein [Pseudorhodoferax soli]RCW75939.1 hypothetical protein DES41_101542 [Pseudorhodoferax soli]